MTLQKINNKFVAATTFAERDIPKAAGFRWDPVNKCWWTDDVKRAARLAEFADESIKADLVALAETRTEALAASRATDVTDIDLPVPCGLSYLPYQRAGISYALRVFGDV